MTPEGIFILFVLLASVFGPMIVFGIVGFKAMDSLGKRPMKGGRVMIPMILKLVVTAAVLIALLAFILEAFGAEPTVLPDNPRLLKKRVMPFDPKQVGRIGAEALAGKIEAAGEGTLSFFLIDLRTESEYKKSHIKGAVSIPYSKLRFLAEKMFAPGDSLVLYGYSGVDPSPMNAAVVLWQKGYTNVQLFEEGFKDWAGATERAVSAAPSKK